MNVCDAGVVVTGGGSGLGRGVAETLAGRGARVVVFDLPSSGGEAVAEALGSPHHFVPCDVTAPDQVADAVRNAAAHLGRLDCLVSCAGILRGERVVGRDGALHGLSSFERHLRVNVTGMFDVIRHIAAVMAGQEPSAEGERGLLLNVASIAAYEGQVGQAAYAASKGAVVAMTLPLARELGTLGIRTVTIAPGTMDTQMLGGLDESARERFAGANAFPKRLGAPDDLGRMVASVMENVFLNGETIRLDAGLRMAPR